MTDRRKIRRWAEQQAARLERLGVAVRVEFAGDVVTVTVGEEEDREWQINLPVRPDAMPAP